MASSNQPDSHQRQLALTGFAARSRDSRRRVVLDHAAAEAIGALEEAGVEVMVLKGAALAQALYAPDRERGYYDIDLLGAPEDGAVTENVLTQLGYRNITRDQGIVDVAGVLHAELWTRRNEVGNVSIDLHRKLPGCRATEETTWQSLRPDAQVIELCSRRALALGRSGLALHLALHLAQHGPSDLKAASDLRLGLARWPYDVWRAATALARDLDGFDAFSAGIRLVPEGESIAQALGLSSGEHVFWDLEHRESRPRGTFHLDALAQTATMRERFGIVRRALLPTPNWIRWEMRWAGRSNVHLAAGYLLHLTRTPLWTARALLFTRRRQH